MSKATPPAPPALTQDEGQPWDLSRLVASAAPPPLPAEEPASELWPTPRQSYPVGEITVATTRRRSPRVPRGLQALVALSVGALVALVGSWRGADALPASATLDAELAAPATVPVAHAAAPAAATPPAVGSSIRVETMEVEEPITVERAPNRVRREATTEPETTVSPPLIAAAQAETQERETLEEEVAAPTTRPIDTATASMDELLDHAVAHVEPLALPTHGDGPEPSTEPAVEESPAPVGPDRDEVQRVMEAIRPALAQCAAGGHGLTQVQLTVTPNGRARAIRIAGPFAGSTEGSCMARAARGARFAGHEGDEDVTIRYPYRF